MYLTRINTFSLPNPSYITGNIVSRSNFIMKGCRATKLERTRIYSLIILIIKNIKFKNMKKLISNFLLGASILAVSACTKIDNYPGPDASFQGRVIDATTNANFETSTNSIQVQLEQISWSSTPTPQYIPSKTDGTFEDTKLFKGTYRIIPKGGAFWPVFDSLKMDINKGSSHDFELTPYLTIKNFTHELNGTTLTLHFDIDAPTVAGLPTIIDA